MRKVYKNFLGVIIVLILLTILLLMGYKYLMHGKSEIEVVDSVKKYGYTLKDRDTEYMQTVFADLKEVLNNKEINYNKYASDITKLFVSDLFTLDNKINKYDVGGYEYVYPDKVKNFKLNVTNTIYKYMENNVNGKRNQKLPVVNNVVINNVENVDYNIEKESYKGKRMNIEINYDEDLGYDKKANITCIIKDDKIYIVSYKPEEQEE